MPELPEVETTRRGVEPHLRDRRIVRLVVREPRLRWPVAPDLPDRIAGHRIAAVARRGKYLLIRTDGGTAILHLGMSGALRLISADTPPARHDHLDFVLDDGRALRLTDPRRFGSLHWTPDDPLNHPLLAGIGPEPLDPGFTGDALYARSRGRRVNVKAFLMDGRIVAGIGNIYANEALHRAGIRPTRPAGRISRNRYRRLARAIRAVLEAAVAAGGTTLRDFTGGDGTPGYFKLSLDVYGRAGESCPACGGPIKQVSLAQRATYYCPLCQR